MVLVNGSYEMTELLVDTFTSLFVQGVPEYTASHQIFDGAMHDVEISVDRVFSSEEFGCKFHYEPR